MYSSETGCGGNRRGGDHARHIVDAARFARHLHVRGVVNVTTRGSFITYNPMDIGVKRPSLAIAAVSNMVVVLARQFCVRPLGEVLCP